MVEIEALRQLTDPALLPDGMDEIDMLTPRQLLPCNPPTIGDASMGDVS
jgi:hypothetical protein